MYFITRKDSETGKKFQALNEKLLEKRAVINKLIEKYGLTNVYVDDPSFGGRIHSVEFKEDPNPKLWKKARKVGYYPKRTKQGIAIIKDFSSVPEISSKDINMCVGFGGAPFNTIGYNLSSPGDYFGFEVADDWKFIQPADCEEVLSSRYREILGIAKY